MKKDIHYAPEIEAAVLGICLLEKTAFGRTHGLIDQECFYNYDNQAVYQHLREMSDHSIPIDLLTVAQRMTEQGVELKAGNTAWYLATLTNYVVASTHLEYHCHLLKTMWRKRELIRLKNTESTEDVDQQIRDLIKSATDIYGTAVKKDWLTMDEVMFELMVHQQRITEGTKEFITTGFKLIDKENGGFSAGQLIILGARPSVGKSALMGKIAQSIALKNKKVGIISLEMNNTEIAARIASLETNIDFGVIYRNLFKDEDEQSSFYNKISKHTIHLPIYISDKTKVDVTEIKSKAAKLKYKHGLDILMVDYLQLVDSSTDNKNYNREQEVGRISRGLKLLAMEMEIPVMVLCQLNRQVTGRGYKDRFPRLSDLRESGSIEQDADVVMMLHSDFKAGIETNPDTGNSTEHEADLLGLKWRNGATFHLPLAFDPPKMKFSEKPTFIPLSVPTNFKDEEDPF